MANIKELNEKDLKQVAGGNDDLLNNQKQTIKNYLTVKCMYNVARSFEANLIGALAVAINTPQKNISINVYNDSIYTTWNNVVHDFDEIMNCLTSYFGG